MAVPFDSDRLEIKGQPFPVVAEVMQELAGLSSSANTAAGQYAISDTGTLVYASGKMIPPFQDSLVWVDQKGRVQPAAPFTAPFLSARLSPDGKRIAYTTLGNKMRIWIYDLEPGTTIRLTSEGTTGFITWDLDGKGLTFNWWRSGNFNLYWQPVDGNTPAERLTTNESLLQEPGPIHPDGKTLAFVDLRPDTGYDILLLDRQTHRVTPLLNSGANESQPAWSPDGRWMAYTSDETGADEVYVRPVSGRGGKWKISDQGGRDPLWQKNGRQLFYRRGDQVWVVDIRTEGDFSSGKPRLLFEKPGFQGGYNNQTWDLSLDGQRFLMVKLEDRKPQPVTELILVQNWFEELKRLVPAGRPGER